MASLEMPSVQAGGAVGRITAAAALLATGLLLVVASAPRLAAGLVKIGGDPGANALERNLPATPDMLDATIESRRAASRWYDPPQFEFDSGSAAKRTYDRLRAVPVPAREEERKYLDLAVERFRAGLAGHPAQPYAWLQLAWLDAMKSDKPSAQTGHWLRMSIRTGPEEPLLVVPRITLALYAWDQLDRETRRLVVRQIEGAAAYRPRELADMALQTGTGEFVRTILAVRPELLATFEEFLFEPEEGSALFR